MQSHVKLLGILHIIWSGLTILGGLIALVVLGGIGGFAAMSDNSNDSFMALPVMGAIGGAIFLFLLLLALPGAICGWGLMHYRSWARMLGIIISVFELLSFPFGTALGIYGLWVLLNNQTEALFRMSPQNP